LRDVRLTPEAVVSGRGEISIDAGLISAAINPDPCIRSGWCVENCPVRIHPAGLLEAAQDDDHVLAEHHGLHACIECGICSYVCPSRLPLLESIRYLRASRAAGATT
jgi:Na+-translocating ferredoxin:NAD+ oxidoreductase RnfC subunit